MNRKLIGENLEAIDQLLTGKSINTVHQTMSGQSNVFAQIEEWRKVEYYLSDGGYSRLWVDPFEGEIFLGGNSREEVKDRWVDPNVQARVKEILDHFSEEKEN